MIIAVFCLLAAAVAAATAVQLPPLAGPYDVGITSIELIDHPRTDPLAPTPNQPRALMVSILYPATPRASDHDPLDVLPYCTAAEAAVFNAIADAAIFSPLANLTAYCTTDTDTDTTSSTTKSHQTHQTHHHPLLTRTHPNAPPLPATAPFPTILFSPGFGSSRLLQAATLADLASRGWVIVNVDHTYDAAAVLFPDGSVRFEQPGLLARLVADLDGVGEELAEVRAGDLRFVYEALRGWAGGGGRGDGGDVVGVLFGGEGGRSRLDRVGLFGGSLGGATAARLLLDGGPYACGANLDGSVYGPVLNTSESRPFLTLATPGHNASSDATFAAFFEELRRGGAFSRVVAVNRTVHQSFLDVPLLRDLLPPVKDALETSEGGPAPDAWGTIGGQRLLQVSNDVADAFFGYCLKGNPAALLDEVVRKFPELSVVD